MKSEREQSRFIKNISYRGAPYTNNFWKNTFSQSISNALEFNDPLHNRELERASQTRSPTGESKHSLFSSKVQQTKPEEWIIGVKFKKIHVCKQMYNLYEQSSWPYVISKYIHTRAVITYLTCCCGPVMTLASWATAVPLHANMLRDGDSLESSLEFRWIGFVAN